MARGRMLSKSLSTSAKFTALYAAAGALAEFCQVLFVLLVAHADEWGRCPGDAWTVKWGVVPLSPRSLEEVDQALTALDDVGLVQRYAVDGQRLIAIAQFDRHQALRLPRRSVLPAPPGTPEASESPDGTGLHDAQPGGTSGLVRTGLHDGPGPVGPVKSPVGTGPRHPRPKEGRKEGREARKEDPAHASRARLSSTDYLRDCPHTPPCVRPWICGKRRQVEQALHAGKIPQAVAARLVRLYRVEAQMAQATLPARPPRAASRKD